MTNPRTVVLLGAAGRDFHNFNVLYRGNTDYRVVAFTATQIPDIAGRAYPAVLAGPGYPDGIPIVDEAELTALLTDNHIDEAVFAYSDVPHERVMHLASQCLAAGADFTLKSGQHTMIRSTKPVIAVTAVRTGVGKSQTTRYLSRMLVDLGLRVVAIRHPMPYGDLAKQACQRFATYADLDRHACTIEEREEYEPHIGSGVVCYAGVDYEQILRAAEAEADVILWDGGNNDLPFYVPDLHLVLADPLRPGDEVRYHPGETNVRMADVVVNGDGYDDLLVGNYYFEHGSSSEGEVVIYLGSAAGVVTPGTQLREGNQTEAYLGWDVAGAGDVNGDGYDDVIYGAVYQDDGETNEGEVWLHLGSSTGVDPTAAWSFQVDQANAGLGASVR